MRTLLFSTFLLLAACTNKPENIKTVIYRFDDASVAPEYQRNYTVTVTENTIGASVDSYGQVLVSSEEPFSPEKFAELQKKTVDIFNRYSGKTKECDGGKAKTFTILDSAGRKKEITWNCVSPPDAVQDFSSYITGFVPDLDKMLATPYPEEKKKTGTE